MGFLFDKERKIWLLTLIRPNKKGKEESFQLFLSFRIKNLNLGNIKFLFLGVPACFFLLWLEEIYSKVNSLLFVAGKLTNRQEVLLGNWGNVAFRLFLRWTEWIAFLRGRKILWCDFWGIHYLLLLHVVIVNIHIFWVTIKVHRFPFIFL